MEVIFFYFYRKMVFLATMYEHSSADENHLGLKKKTRKREGNKNNEKLFFFFVCVCVCVFEKNQDSVGV